MKITKSMILGIIHKYREYIRGWRCGGNIKKRGMDHLLELEGYKKNDSDT